MAKRKNTPARQIIDRTIAKEHVKLGMSIKELAEQHGYTYGGMWRKLNSPEMAEVLADIEAEVVGMAADAQLFIRANYPEYIREMHTLAMGNSKHKYKALEHQLSRLMPVVQHVAVETKHELTGEAAEQFTATFSVMEKVLEALPTPGAIKNDPHLLSGTDALPKPGAIDVDYTPDDYVDWLLELSSALDTAISEATEDDKSEVTITVDLAKQISKHIKVIVSSAAPVSDS